MLTLICPTCKKDLFWQESHEGGYSEWEVYPCACNDKWARDFQVQAKVVGEAFEKAQQELIDKARVLEECREALEEWYWSLQEVTDLLAEYKPPP